MKERKKENIILTVFLAGSLFIFGFLGSFSFAGKEKDTMTSSGKPVVVIDAGHGGIDPGKVGVSGSYEKNINLSIAKYVKEYLEKEKIGVFMTREEDTGLYTEEDTQKKRADMHARIDMMNQPEVDLVVSIHQNSFTAGDSRGAQVFYQESSKNGEILAKKLQEILISDVDPENHRQAKANNSYYILKKTEKPAVIVECGFLSNPEEEQKLLDQKYQKKIAAAIRKGIMSYLSKEVPDKAETNG